MRGLSTQHIIVWLLLYFVELWKALIYRGLPSLSGRACQRPDRKRPECVAGVNVPMTIGVPLLPEDECDAGSPEDLDVALPETQPGRMLPSSVCPLAGDRA